jgi:hypothetical protein
MIEKRVLAAMKPYASVEKCGTSTTLTTDSGVLIWGCFDMSEKKFDRDI